MKKLLGTSILSLAVVFVALTAKPAHSVSTGDQFVFRATETSQNYQDYPVDAIYGQSTSPLVNTSVLTGTPVLVLDPNYNNIYTTNVTLGAPSGSYFKIASFTGLDSIISSGATVDLSLLLFDTVDSALIGDITGSYLGVGGGLHLFDLKLSETGTGLGSWIFYDDHTGQSPLGQGAVFTQLSSGTYSIERAPVPEPPALLLLGFSLVGLAARVRRKTI